MPYKPDITDAIALACRFHRYQTDKAGKPYILHLLRVALSFDDEDLQIISILHDILEDTSCTVDDLRSAAFSEDVISDVLALTRGDDEPYDNYIIRVSNNPNARKVKLADLNDNLNLKRIDNPTDTDMRRWKKYIKARAFLIVAEES